MIDGTDEEGYALYCDCCGDSCDELFDSFQDAVDYKVDRDNGWASVKDKNDDWQELCPSCNRPGIIAKLKGMERLESPKESGRDLARLAALDQAEFEGF